MKRYVKSNNEISLTAYHVSFKPVKCLRVERTRFAGSLGIHFVLSEEDAHVIAPKLIHEGKAYVYRCNLVNLRCKDVRDCNWVSAQLVNELFDCGRGSYNNYSRYVDALQGLSRCEDLEHKAKYLRDVLEGIGFNCLRYENSVERGLANECLCVIDNSCIQNVQLIECIELS